MIVNQDQQTELLQIVNQHPLAPTTGALTSIINSAIDKKQTLEELHDAIDIELNRVSARGGFFARIFLRTGHHQDILAISLLTTMIAQRGNAGIATPCSSEQFIRDLFISHIEYGEQDSFFVNNSLVEVIDYYKKNHLLYLTNQNSAQKHFYVRQLLSLTNWCTENEYTSLIKIMNNAQSMVNSTFFILAFDKVKVKSIHETQQLLCWIGVVIDKMKASETAFAMSEALELIFYKVDFNKRQGLNTYLYLINQFKSFYLDLNNTSSINIDSDNRDALLENIKAMNEANAEKNQERILRLKENITKNLTGLYNELALLLVCNKAQIKIEFNKLNIQNQDAAVKFKQYFNSALNFRVSSINKKYKVTSKGDYFPFEVYENKFIFFTPDDWASSEKLTTELSRRLSSRSSDKNSTRSGSISIRASESSSSKLSEEGMARSPETSLSTKGRLSQMYRSYSTTSLSSSVSEESLVDSSSNKGTLTSFQT